MDASHGHGHVAGKEEAAIPAVKAQLEYLASMLEHIFWEGIDLKGLEELRLRLRGLMPLESGC